ncbi:MAG: hypothetical protein V7609_2276 [Verrucomicrobiota bacterium]
MLGPEFIAGNERVLIGADVVITIRPIVDAAAAIEARFRRQGRPADIVFARAPGNPGRRPFVARHPNPADAAESQPASVVISRPAKGLVRNPGPTGIGISPMAIRVRSPARFFGLARLPDVTVVRRFSPGTVRLELLVKRAVGCSRFVPGFGSRFRLLARDSLRRSHGWCNRCGRRFFIRQRFLPRFQISLLLREALLLVGLAFRRETFLHLAFDFRFFLLLGLLLLAGNKKCERSDKRENTKFLHGEIRHGWLWVIRSKTDHGRIPRRDPPN